MTNPLPRRRAAWAVAGVGAAVAALAAVAGVAVWTGPERGAVRTYSRLIGAANRQDAAEAAALCSSRYRATHPLKPAAEGGIVGLPRNMHPNFQVWRHGRDVWLCPTNRVGPVYQFVREPGGWRFDGPVGILMPGGRVEQLGDIGADEPSAD
jgi:hypothetical protein